MCSAPTHTRKNMQELLHLQLYGIGLFYPSATRGNWRQPKPWTQQPQWSYRIRRPGLLFLEPTNTPKKGETEITSYLKCWPSVISFWTGIQQQAGVWDCLIFHRANPVLNMNIDTATDLGFDEDGSSADRERYSESTLYASSWRFAV